MTNSHCHIHILTVSHCHQSLHVEGSAMMPHSSCHWRCSDMTKCCYIRYDMTFPIYQLRNIYSGGKNRSLFTHSTFSLLSLHLVCCLSAMWEFVLVIGCCLFQAVCCADGFHCCPSGYKCNRQQETCDSVLTPPGKAAFLMKIIAGGN